MLSRLLHPGRFQEAARRAIPWLAAITGLLFLTGLYMALFASPPDYQQGEAVRIMYVHVPAAVLSLVVYCFMAAASALGLIGRNPLAFIMAEAAAPLGAGFTLICLGTGSLWGKPIWGAWWVWDARLTSVLILFFFYLAYMALAQSFSTPERGEKPAAILCLVGLVNIPIVKFSVDFWHSLHQPASILRWEGPSIHSSMLIPLLVMLGGFFSYFLTLWLIRIQTGIAARKHLQQKRLIAL